MSGPHRTWQQVKAAIYDTPAKVEELEEARAGLEEAGELPPLTREATFDRYVDAPAIAPGTNMERCPRCTDPNPAYPWICPGHPTERVLRPKQTLTIETRVPEKYALVDLETNQVWRMDECGHWRPFGPGHQVVQAATRAARASQRLNVTLVQGMLQAAAGQTTNRGDFSRYLAEDNDNDGEPD